MEELGMKKDAPDQETEKGCLLNLWSILMNPCLLLEHFSDMKQKNWAV